ncbi:hypothetical protein TNCV_3294551 [Trichonephila clavipes]|nr:hypothetical protein TNCV_3294551 [Trichonephila clavipes]
MTSSPSATKYLLCEVTRKFVEAQNPQVCEMWKFGGKDALLVIWPWFRIMRSFANCPGGVLLCDINKHSVTGLYAIFTN